MSLKDDLDRIVKKARIDQENDMKVIQERRRALWNNIRESDPSLAELMEIVKKEFGMAGFKYEQDGKVMIDTLKLHEPEGKQYKPLPLKFTPGKTCDECKNWESDIWEKRRTYGIGLCKKGVTKPTPWPKQNACVKFQQK